MKNSLALAAITKHYQSAGRSVPVLTGVSADFEQSESYALCGVSGSGKSTLLSILAGFEQPTTGSVLWNGRCRSTWTAVESAAFLYHGVGMLFQRPYLIRELTIFENVTLKGWGRGTDSALVAERAHELLERVGLAQFLERYPYELSGGEQSRAALVRALAYPPQFLIADEPTAHLDHDTAERILDTIFDEADRVQSGIIIATHDPRVSARCAQKYTLHSGSISSSCIL